MGLIEITMDKDMIEFRVPSKSHIHTNPDGSTIQINAIDIKHRQMWRKDVKDWVYCEKKIRAKLQPQYADLQFGSNNLDPFDD